MQNIVCFSLCPDKECIQFLSLITFQTLSFSSFQSLSQITCQSMRLGEGGDKSVVSMILWLLLGF